MQNFRTLRQPLLGELAMSRKKRERERREKNAIYSGHLRLCQQPRAAHALRSDQYITKVEWDLYAFLEIVENKVLGVSLLFLLPSVQSAGWVSKDRNI